MIPQQASYLQELNDVQRDAVTTINGPVMVIAGPGSGKTRVLTYRVAHLMHSGVRPHQILTLTFTNKAAREMKDRIERVVGKEAQYVWAGTFHSIFARILRYESEAIDFPGNFTIYDTDDSKNLIKQILSDLKLDTKVYKPNAVRNRISSAKCNLISPEKYMNNLELLQQDKKNRRPYMADIYKQYARRCKRAGAMDFDDLLYQTYILFDQNEAALQKYRDRFTHLLVDEFQDTNYLQYAIIRKLTDYPGSPHNICIVGDDAQSIYAFRGATIQNILDFQSDFPEVQVFKLEQNYRSTPHIVKAANSVISHNKKQLKKTIWTENDAGQKIKVVRTLTDSEEGKRVADMILEQKNRNHLSNREIAILYRTNAQSRIFEEYLRRYNIPYRIFGGLSFYQRKEIKDVLGYLRLIVNYRDLEAFRRVVNYPKRGIGKATVDKIMLFSQQKGQTILQAAVNCPLPARARGAVDRFLEMMKYFIDFSKSHDAYETTTEVVKKTKILKKLNEDKSPENISRVENINALLDAVQAFVENDEVTSEETSDDRSLAAYLQNIALLTDADEADENADYVTLMSSHAVKGLEFPSVFLVGVEENLFPSFMSMDSQDGIDEERRLFYVAITRAERFLTITHAENRIQYGKTRYNKPSRFLEELDPQCLDRPEGRKTGSSGFSGPGSSPRASVKGIIRRRGPMANQTIDPASFKPSPTEKIAAGQKVRHLKFGEGKVLSIDGQNDKRVATVYFQGIDNPERRIMLKFAKLEIVG